jgi:hypothetical protein
MTEPLDINTGIAYKTQALERRMVNRHSDLVTRRNRYDDQADVICEVLRPDLVKGKVGEKDEGGFASSKIVEGTGPHAVQVWQRGFYGNMVSRKSDWFRDRLMDPPKWTGVTFTGNDEVNTYLQDVDDHLRAVYRRSNFYDVMPNYVMDGGTVGSPVMLRERDYEHDRIICKVPDYSQRWIDKDIFGYDNCLHVEWRWNVLQILEYFDEDDLPQNIKIAITNGTHYQKFNFLQVVYPAGDRIFDDLNVRVTHPWMEFFIPLDCNEHERKVLTPRKRGKGYFRRPFSTWHYWRNWHETYGKSMGWWAIYDVKGNSAHWEALFGEAEMAVRPPVWAMGTLRGLLDISPNGQMYARDTDEYERPPQFLERKTRYQVAIDFADRLSNAIKRHFHNDLFMGTNMLEMGRNQPETAYGLWLMQSERHVQLLPQVETYENQVLKDNHESFIEMEIRAEPAYPWGRLPEPPDIVKEHAQYMENESSEVEFIGQLSIAQERDVTIGRFLKSIGISEMLYQFKSELVDKVKWSQAYEKILEANNFPQGDIVPEDEYQALLDAMNQRVQQAELAEQAPKVAQAVKSLQGKTEETSPLAALAG